MCDSITCLATITMRGFPSFCNKDVDAFGFTVSWVLGPLSYITWTGSIYLTVFLSFKLYSVICREKLVTNKRTYQVEGAIKGVWSFKATLFVDMKVRKWSIIRHEVYKGFSKFSPLKTSCLLMDRLLDQNLMSNNGPKTSCHLIDP